MIITDSSLISRQTSAARSLSSTYNLHRPNVRKSWPIQSIVGGIHEEEIAEQTHV